MDVSYSAYPHRCGKNLRLKRLTTLVSGISPRVWEKHLEPSRYTVIPGISPRVWEKRWKGRGYVQTTGISPRVWEKRVHDCLKHRERRHIPTGVGKTLDQNRELRKIPTLRVTELKGLPWDGPKVIHNQMLAFDQCPPQKPSESYPCG